MSDLTTAERVQRHLNELQRTSFIPDADIMHGFALWLNEYADTALKKGNEKRADQLDVLAARVTNAAI